MIKDKRKFRGLVIDITGNSNDAISALEQFKKYEIMLDMEMWEKGETIAYGKARDYIHTILIQCTNDINFQGNQDRLSVIIDNLYPATPEWWYLYDMSLAFMLPVNVLTSIHNILMQMYCDFVHADDNMKQEKENILDRLQRESEESKQCLSFDIDLKTFTKSLNDIIEKYGMSDDVILEKVKEKNLLISKNYRDMGCIMKINRALTSIMEILFTAYYCSGKDDNACKQDIKRLAQNLDINNIYWWHLYDDTYLKAAIIDKKTMEAIHAVLITLYKSLVLDEVISSKVSSLLNRICK